jgi:quinol monooxygenase YgiN
MPTIDRCVSLHPYFAVPENNLDAFKLLCEKFVAQTSTEPRCLYYGFSFNGGEVHCREGYEDADGLLAHLDNVKSLLDEALTLAQVIRLEVHGPEDELAKLREPLAAFNPAFFVLKYGIRRESPATVANVSG